MKRIQDYWLKQSAAEYNSASRTIHLVHWMQKAAMSPDLIRDAIRIADDEMVHAQMCYLIASESGSNSILSNENLSLSLTKRYEDLRYNILHVLVESFCFGETAAVPLFREMKRYAKCESVVAVYNRILKDEPNHAKFGWLALAWCDDNWQETRLWLKDIVPQALSNIVNGYIVNDEYKPELSRNEKNWGLMPKYKYKLVLEKVIDDKYKPRLRHYGVDLNYEKTINPN